jgi:hypothetical protein
MLLQEGPKPVSTKRNSGLRHVRKGDTKFCQLGAAELEEDCWVWFEVAALSGAEGVELALVANRVFRVAGFHFMLAMPAGRKGGDRGGIWVGSEIGRDEGGDGAHDAGGEMGREREAVAGR